MRPRAGEELDRPVYPPGRRPLTGKPMNDGGWRWGGLGVWPQIGEPDALQSGPMNYMALRIYPAKLIISWRMPPIRWIRKPLVIDPSMGFRFGPLHYHLTTLRRTGIYMARADTADMQYTGDTAADILWALENAGFDVSWKIQESRWL